MSDQPQHTVRIEIAEGGAYPIMTCPFDPTDRTRPCWEHEENGDPFEASTDCVWKEWMEADGGESIPTVTIEFPIAKATWQGDFMEFTLGDVANAALGQAVEVQPKDAPLVARGLRVASHSTPLFTVKECAALRSIANRLDPDGAM